MNASVRHTGVGTEPGSVADRRSASRGRSGAVVGPVEPADELGVDVTEAGHLDPVREQGVEPCGGLEALLSWLAVAWVVLTSCQLAVTVAGNLAVLPLTGVTFPFVSFGMTSLLVNLGFLALCINVDLPPSSSREVHG